MGIEIDKQLLLSSLTVANNIITVMGERKMYHILNEEESMTHRAALRFAGAHFRLQSTIAEQIIRRIEKGEEVDEYPNIEGLENGDSLAGSGS